MPRPNLAAQLDREVDPKAIEEDLVEAVVETVQPKRVNVGVVSRYEVMGGF